MDKFVKLSLKKLGLDYLDMYLIHTPFAFKFDEKTGIAATHEDGSYVLDFDTDLVAIWKVCVQDIMLCCKEISEKIEIILQQMEEQVKAGHIRSIGLSNFNEEQVSTIWENAEIKPSNLQVSPRFYTYVNSFAK